MSQLLSGRIASATRPTHRARRTGVAGRLACFAAAAVTALAAAISVQAQPNLVAGAAAQAAAQAARHEAAHEAYAIGHYDTAFAAFALLADEGHCESARIAQEMVRYGRPLYATTFTVAPGRLTRWRTLPGCGLAPTTR